tara:strand:+ start:1904 stop:3085 length:1182 start_codon:yes stop_codon:yes gene_type:complete
MKKKLSVFGCTGSIGDTTFKLFKKKNKDYAFYILTGYKNYKKIKYLIKHYKPKFFVIFDNETYLRIKKEFIKKKVKILNSKKFYEFKFKKSDISILAIPGIAGLEPSLNIIKSSKKILIANKESVVCGWNLINKISKKYNVQILPVDSEHFSIKNLINQTDKKSIEKIYLTASGGPFLNYPLRKMKKIKPSQAVNHPKWKMGKKISIDSATLINKIFEVIEANKLFSIDFKKIDILIHPQSLVHAVVKFKNGLYKLLYFETDMSIPIGNALFGSNFDIQKLPNADYKLKKDNLAKELNFYKVDQKKFPAIKLKPILNKYNSIPIILNAANEIFVDQFLKKNISFCSIINYMFVLLKDPKMRKYAIKKPSNLKTILTIDKWTRNQAMIILNKKN